MGNHFKKSKTNFNNIDDLSKPLLATELQEIYKAIAYLESKIDTLDDKQWVFESKINSKLNKIINS